MTTRFVPLALALTSASLVACSFQVGSGSGSQTPQNQPNGAAPAPQGQAAQPGQPAQPAGSKFSGLRPTVGKTRATIATPTPASPNTTPPPAPPPTPAGIPLVNAPTAFGSGTASATGWKGSIYWIPAGTAKLPDLGTMQPNGYVFANELNIAPKTFTEGFPGVDAARKENFAIRYEAPLIVNTEADYDFRLVSDDGTILKIDGMAIVDNDGAHSAPVEKSGPVHLVKGTHVITVDYFQGTGNIALQVFCKSAAMAEKICPTTL